MTRLLSALARLDVSDAWFLWVVMAAFVVTFGWAVVVTGRAW